VLCWCWCWCNCVMGGTDARLEQNIFLYMAQKPLIASSLLKRQRSDSFENFLCFNEPEVSSSSAFASCPHRCYIYTYIPYIYTHSIYTFVYTYTPYMSCDSLWVCVCVCLLRAIYPPLSTSQKPCPVSDLPLFFLASVVVFLYAIVASPFVVLLVFLSNGKLLKRKAKLHAPFSAQRRRRL